MKNVAVCKGHLVTWACGQDLGDKESVQKFGRAA
jgi:hypothetical protein